MLSEAPRVVETVFLGVGIMGAAVLIYAVIAKKGIALFTTGALAAAAAFAAPLLIRGQPLDVIVIREEAGVVSVHRQPRFYGGTYVTVGGTSVAVGSGERRRTITTVVLNDSARLVKATAYGYSAFRNAPGGPEVIAFLLPRQGKQIHRTIDYVGAEDTRPPAEIVSASQNDVRIVLSYSRQPYDETIHGSRADLLDGIAAPDETPSWPLAAKTSGDGEAMR